MAVNIDSAEVSDYALRAVAKELNQKLGLTPPIDISLSGELLKSAVIVAAALIWETDDISEQTKKILADLKGGKVEPELVDDPEDLYEHEQSTGLQTPIPEKTEDTKIEEEKQQVQKDTPGDDGVEQDSVESNNVSENKNDENEQITKELTVDQKVTEDAPGSDEDTSESETETETDLEKKYPKLKPEWRYLVSLISVRAIPKKELVEAVHESYPQVSKSTISTCIQDSRNPKYTRLKYGYIEKDKNDNLYFKPFEEK